MTILHEPTSRAVRARVDAPYAATADAVTPFELPSLWLAMAAVELGLDDEDRVRLSPGAAFPTSLRSVVAALPRDTRTLVDVGAGIGATSERLRRATGARVIAVEPAATARLVAHCLFPDLVVVHGTATATTLASSCADAATLCGVLTLVDQVDLVMEEVARVLAPHGTVAIADLVTNGAADVVSGPNVFRSVEHLVEALHRHGFTVLEVGCGSARPSGRDADVAGLVEQWIDTHCSWHPAYEEWRADRHHLQRHVDAGTVLGACVVARR